MRFIARILALSLATIAVQGSAAVTVPEPAGEVGVAHTNVPSVAAIVGSGAMEAPLRTLTPLRHLAAPRPPAPGSFGLLMAGLAGIWSIARRRVASIGDRSIARYRLRGE
jgi:hypothetical protein